MTRPDRTAAEVTILTRLLFVAAVGLLAVRAAGYLIAASNLTRLIGALLLIAYLIWLLLEVRVTFRAPPAPAAETTTLAVYACVRMLLVILTALPALPRQAWSAWLIAPLAIFVAGIAVRVSAIRALGAVYSHHVVRLKQHPLVTSGPYRLVRHPAYAGMLAANAGFVLFFRSGPGAVAWLLLLAVLIWRIRVEERVLWPLPGYPEFAANHARLLPGVW